jgi:hypothetical protein
MSGISILGEAERTVAALQGSHDTQAVIGPFGDVLQTMETAYAELSSISRYRAAYNSSWAFSYAFTRMHALVNQLLTEEVTAKIRQYTDRSKNRASREDIIRKYAKITENLSDLIRRTGTSQRLYRTTIWLLSLAEGLISLIIVVLITQFSAAFSRAVSLPKLSLLFLTVFGSLRLLLERLKSRVLENWRWTRYQESVDRAFGSIAAAAGISFLLAYHIRQGTFLDQIDDLLEDGAVLLSAKPSPEQRRLRRAAHRSARLIALQRERIERLQGPVFPGHSGESRILIPRLPRQNAPASPPNLRVRASAVLRSIMDRRTRD